MPRYDYPVKIETKSGSVNTGWSDGQTTDPLLIDMFIENMACLLIRLKDSYDNQESANTIQNHLNIILNSIKTQKSAIRSRKKDYEEYVNKN